MAWFDALGACRRKATIPRGNDVPWLRNYFYSPEESLLQQTDSQGGTVAYRYDAAERIAEAKPAIGMPQLYEYDAAGNLLRQPGLQGVHVLPGNQIARANGATFAYDARGNLVSRQAGNRNVHYRYNELDLLVAVELDGQTWTATYDAFARRRTKTWQGRTTTYYWDDFRLAAEVRHDGSVLLYVYFDQVALVPFMFVEYAALDAEPASGRRYYLFTNQVGAPLRVEDDGGRSVWDARLEPYGAAQVNPRSSIEMPLRFPGALLRPGDRAALQSVPILQSGTGEVLDANRARNKGVLRDDRTGEIPSEPKQSKKGKKPKDNEAQVDHVFPRSKGGPNSFRNAEVRSRKSNIEKSNTVEE
ncbi:MAG: HNH endonuclease domain-containing protein [Planctomycetia bacterium]|nr:HNH endonuclease domain-containing protein [Planctomycetia bacterium]